NAASKRVGGSRRQAQIQHKSSMEHEAGSIPSHQIEGLQEAARFLVTSMEKINMRKFLIPFLVLGISFAAIGVTSLKAADLVESGQYGQKLQREDPDVKVGSGTT